MLCWHGRVRVVVAKAIGQFVNRDIEPRLAVSGESPMPVPGATEHENPQWPANKGGGARGPAEVVVSMVQHGSAEPEGESDPQPREHHGISPPSPGEHVWEIFAKTGVAWSPRHSGEGSEVRGWGWVWSVSGARGSMCIKRG